MSENEDLQPIEREHTSNLTALNTQILNSQKDILDRYSKALGVSRGWLVRKALGDLFNQYLDMGIKPGVDK